MKNSSARNLEPTTVPPPAGANDVYSAQTRLGSLPEDVLAAMRDEELDVRYLRTRSGTQRAVRPPPLPKAASVHPARPETPEPFSSVRPRSLPHAAHASEAEAVSELDLVLDEASVIPTESFEIVVEEDGAPPRSSLARSLVIVALFAVLGGLAACALMLLG